MTLVQKLNKILDEGEKEFREKKKNLKSREWLYNAACTFISTVSNWIGAPTTPEYVKYSLHYFLEPHYDKIFS
ncbi:hypothetical protein HZA33_05525 [Candidatus Pacearchaeota archaeon]|nr:hypothetical protein [Candidatus Pacearchaeota archaeon]